MTAKVTVLPFGDTLEIDPSESVLDALLRQGRFVRYGCKHGGCGTCRAHLADGDCRLGDQTSFSLSDADREAGVVLMCSTFVDAGHAVLDLGDTMELTEDEFHAGQQITQYAATVDRLDALTHDIRWLGLRLEGPMEFVAGQYVEVAIPGSADEWRSFSMANPPQDRDRVDLIIKVIPGGRFSSMLEGTVSVGDALRLRGPFGQFGVRLSHRPIVMVAGGSGMAPIWSMLHDLVASGNNRQVTFLYGARTDRDLFLVDELAHLVDENDWLTFVPALSEPDRNEKPWPGDTGLVTDALARRLPSLRGHEAYLCGPPPMIDAGVDVITTLGCKERHVYFDRFVPTG